MPDGDCTPFSYGARRVQAALLADPTLDDAEVRLVEAQATDPETWIAEVEALDADVIGLSAYVWSFPTFVEVARQLKRRRPDRTVVFGGPSARPAMFTFPPWRESAAEVDALVIGGGELAFRALVRAGPRSRDDLRAVPGLHLPSRGGFQPTAPAPDPVALDHLPSPAVMGLLPARRTAPLEIFRSPELFCGCCSPGSREDGPGTIFSEDYLAAELSALRDARAPGAELVGAALHRSPRAFANLRAAERRAGFFKDAALFASVDPAELDDEHLAFLRGVARARLDVPLRPSPGADPAWRGARFAAALEDLAAFAQVEVELILGLPGDTPASFREALDRARELPCKVRIFHALVLPDDLMARAPASFEMRFDPVTLMMRSCLGWSEDALARERNRLIEMAYREGGEITPGMWSFPGPSRPRRSRRPAAEALQPGEPRAERLPDLGAAVAEIAAVPDAPVQIHEAQEDELAPASVDLQVVLEEGIRHATSGGWTFVEASTRPGELVVIMKTRDGALVLEMRPASPAAHAYKVVGGVAFGYSTPRGARMSEGALRLLDRVLQTMHGPARSALGLDSASPAPASVRVRRLPVAP